MLGPVGIRRDGVDRPLGSGRRAAVLVVLALAGEATREQLIAAVWGDDPPASANGNIYTHVNALREMLGGRLLTREDGVYRLRVTEQMVDARRFEALRDRARQHRADGNRVAELTALDEALACWVGGTPAGEMRAGEAQAGGTPAGEAWAGEALAGVPGPYADAHRARLRELRRVSEQRRAELRRELEADVRRSPAREIVRAVVYLGPGATVDEVVQVTGLSAAAVEQASDDLLITASGTVALRDPGLGREWYGRTPETLRAARHEFFAQLIADAFGPPERVAAQLLRAGPAPLSPAASRWLLENVDDLVHRSPAAAVTLLRRAHLQHLPDPEVHVALSVWLARLLYGQGRDAVAEAAWVAARTGDPEVRAEMLWIAARSHERQDRPVAAADLARSVLGHRQHAQQWLDRFRGLLGRLRLRLPGVSTEPSHGRAGMVSDAELSAYRRAIAPEGPS